MSVSVEITITGDLYPAQRDVAEHIIRAAAEAAGIDPSVVSAWEMRAREGRPFFGDRPFTPTDAASEVQVHFSYHRDPAPEATADG